MKRLLCFLSLLCLGFHPITEEILKEKTWSHAPSGLQRLYAFPRYREAFERGWKNIQSFPTLENLITLDQKARRAVNSGSMETFLYQLGLLTRRLLAFTDLGNQMTHQEKKEWDYLVLSKQKKVPVIFYGFPFSFPRQSSEPYIRQYLVRRSTWITHFHQEIARYKQRPAYPHMDDRSSGFGLASLVLNHTFTLLENIWYDIWVSAGGAWAPLTPDYRSSALWILGYGY